jgi:hypothetical protein
LQGERRFGVLLQMKIPWIEQPAIDQF